MRRGPKIALIAVTGVAVIAGLATFGAYRFVRTRSGSEFLLARAKSMASGYGIQFGYSKGEIDPFGYLHFENLKVVKGAGDDRLELFIKLLDVKYALSIFGRSVEVVLARVEAPAVLFRKIASVVEPSPEPVPGAPSGIESARRFMISPPARIKVKNFTVTDLSVDAEMRNPAGATSATIHNASLSATLDLAGGELGFAGTAKLGDKASVKWSAKTGEQETEIQATPYAEMKMAGEIRRRDGKWTYEVKPSDVTMGAKHVAFALTVSEKRQTGRIEPIHLTSNLKLLASTAELFQLDRDSLRTLDSESVLTTGRGSFEATKLGPQKATLTIAQAVGVRATFGYTLSEIVSKAILRAPVRLEAKGKAQIAKDFTHADADASTTLNGNDVATLSLQSEAKDGLTLAGTINAALTAKLLALFKPEAGAGAAGLLHAEGNVTGKLEGKFASFVDLTPEKISDVRANGEVKGEVVQDDRRGSKFAFSPFHFASTLRQEGTSTALKANVTSTSVKGPGFLRALAPSLTASLDWNGTKKRAAFEGSAKIDDEEVAHFKGSSHGDGKLTTIEAAIDAMAGESVAAFVPQEKWDGYGRWRSKTNLTLESGGETLRGGGSTVVSQTRAVESKGQRLSLPDPIEITHKFDFDHGKKTVDLALTVPTIDIEGVAKIAATQGQATLRSPDAERPRDHDIDVQFQQGEITIAEEMSRERPTLQGLGFKLKANTRGDRFTLQSFAANFNREMVKLTADASGRLKTQDFQMSGRLTAEIPKNFPPIADQQIHGRLDLPWTMSILRGHEISLDGELGLTEVAWAKGVRRVSGITGRIPLSEKLILEDKRVRFAYLIDQNPFERVDFERIRPLITRADQIRIQEIGFEEKSYGPFVGFFSMRQNLIFAHQFDFTLGKSGLAYGELYFNVYPDNLQLGFLSRLTALNLEDVLPRKYLVKVPKGDKNISARAGMVINLNRSSVDGRIDITEIGASQLITLINALDPKFEDEKMNLARTALGIGYPTFVQMALQKGFLDMGVNITALGISQRFDVRGIPISTWVNAATSDLVKTTQESPLK